MSDCTNVIDNKVVAKCQHLSLSLSPAGVCLQPDRIDADSRMLGTKLYTDTYPAWGGATCSKFIPIVKHASA